MKIPSNAFNMYATDGAYIEDIGRYIPTSKEQHRSQLQGQNDLDQPKVITGPDPKHEFSIYTTLFRHSDWLCRNF